MDKTIFECKKYVTNSIFIKKALALNLTLQEFLMLTYFDNDYNSFLNLEEVSKNLGLTLDETYKIFNNLISKKLITIESTKDIENRLIERVSLDKFYEMIVEEKVVEKKVTQKKDIYSHFESEFGRTISRYEYEIINAWLENNYSEELILGALKTAVKNNAKSLRYIDKVLYEWSKEGFKNMSDVSNHLENKEEKVEHRELFDYNWLDDNDDE